jgi:hypothetical protein
MVADKTRFPSAPFSERDIRRDLEARHNPITQLLDDGAQRIHCDSSGDGWASLVESIHWLERICGKPYVQAHGWHWRVGEREAQHCTRQLHIDENTYRALGEFRSGCTLIIAHG